MALETLTLTPPSGSPIPLNGSPSSPAAPYWALEELDLGNPARREDLVASTDASGALPARVSTRDVREVTATVRLLDAPSMDAALNALATLEAALESAERLAAANPTNPVTDLVRLVYSPAGADASFSLIVLSAEISEIPRSLSGDDAGWFIARPVVTVKATCDPFAYGALATYLDTTTSGGVYGASVTVPGGLGEVSPWLRLSIKDVASPNRLRGRVVAGVRVGESTTNPVILASALSPIAADISSGSATVFATQEDWVAAAALPQQTRRGPFKVFLLEAQQATTSSPSQMVRLSWAEAGSSRRTSSPAWVPEGGVSDIYLGEVSVDSNWNAWIETKGNLTFRAVLLLPSDSAIEVSAASPSQQLAGAKLVSDLLNTTSSSISGRSLLTGSGSWSQVGSGTWSVSESTLAQRSTQGGATPLFALAGLASYLGLDLRFRSRVVRGPSDPWTSGGIPFMGAVARYASSSNFLVAGYRPGSVASEGIPGLWKVISGSYIPLWLGEPVAEALPLSYLQYGESYWHLQVTEDGRWFISLKIKTSSDPVPRYSVSASGQDADLIAGGTLGGSTSRVGLFDRYTLSSPVINRQLGDFSVSTLAGVTPPPLTNGGSLVLEGSKLVNDSGGEYPYIGSSGLSLRPGVDNNLTVFARRSAGLQVAGAAFTDPLDLDIVGYPRFISVPHT